MRGYRAQQAAHKARRAALHAQHAGRMQRMSKVSAAWQQQFDRAHGIIDRAIGATQSRQAAPQPPKPADYISVKLAQAKAVLATGDTKAAADMTFAALQLYKAADKSMLPSESMQVLTDLNQMTTQIETVKAQQETTVLAQLDNWSAEDDAALFDGLLDEPIVQPTVAGLSDIDESVLADLEAVDPEFDAATTVALDEAEEMDDAWAAELAELEADLYDETGIELGAVTPTAGAVFDLEEELAWELLGEPGAVSLEAAAMLLPEAPTHDPRGRPDPGAGAGGSNPGGGMSDLEASRRAFDMLRSVEAKMSGPLDGFADDVMDLASELADDRAELASVGSNAGAMSSRPFMRGLMGEAGSLLAQADRLLEHDAPSFGG